jgi:hypothetical protein
VSPVLPTKRYCNTGDFILLIDYLRVPVETCLNRFGSDINDEKHTIYGCDYMPLPASVLLTGQGGAGLVSKKEMMPPQGAIRSGGCTSQPGVRNHKTTSVYRFVFIWEN